jgi:hypothetical protein
MAPKIQKWPHPFSLQKIQKGPQKLQKVFLLYSIFGIIFVFLGGFCIIWENFVLFGGLLYYLRSFLYFFGRKTVEPFLYFLGGFLFFLGKKSGGIFVFFGGMFAFSGLVFNIILYIMAIGLKF